MFGLSMGEILLLAAIALIVIGPKQLPEFARQVGKILNEIKRAAGNLSDELKQQASQIKVEDVPPHSPIGEEQNLPASAGTPSLSVTPIPAAEKKDTSS